MLQKDISTQDRKLTRRPRRDRQGPRSGQEWRLWQALWSMYYWGTVGRKFWLLIN